MSFIIFLHSTFFNCLFNRTQGKAESINMEQLINFLNEKQRDPRMNEILYPLYDEKRSQEIIDTYEQNEEARTTSKLQLSLL